MRRAPPAASTIHSAQALPPVALELSTGSTDGNICAACCANIIVPTLSQLLARVGFCAVIRQSNTLHHTVRHQVEPGGAHGGSSGGEGSSVRAGSALVVWCEP